MAQFLDAHHENDEIEQGTANDERRREAVAGMGVVRNS
jgi:hypothetical protein